MLTSSEDWSHGTAAGFRAGARNGTVLLAGPNGLAEPVTTFLRRRTHGISSLLIMGDTDILSTRVDAAVQASR